MFNLSWPAAAAMVSILSIFAATLLKILGDKRKTHKEANEEQDTNSLLEGQKRLAEDVNSLIDDKTAHEDISKELEKITTIINEYKGLVIEMKANVSNDRERLDKLEIKYERLLDKFTEWLVTIKQNLK